METRTLPTLPLCHALGGGRGEQASHNEEIRGPGIGPQRGHSEGETEREAGREGKGGIRKKE